MQEQTEPTIEEIVFQNAFESTLRFLHDRVQSGTMTLAEAEGELHHLSIYEGQDWGGRGEIKNSEIQGQVYAYIQVIDELKKKPSA
jgi:hypothetical protein